MSPWEKLTHDTINAARKVRCSPAEFREALGEIIEELRMEIASSEEMEARGNPGPVLCECPDATGGPK